MRFNRNKITATPNEPDADEDFVAIGVTVLDGEADHAAIIIQYRGDIFELEFTGATVNFGLNTKSYRQSIVRSIETDDVPAFFAMCGKVVEEADPKFDFFYSGEYYNRIGRHMGRGATGERMTCVGFCLNVLKGFLTEDYLRYEDWGPESSEIDGFVENYCRQHGFAKELIQKAHRRIAPDELLASAFFSDPPVRKAQIDSIIEKVRTTLRDL